VKIYMFDSATTMYGNRRLVLLWGCNMTSGQETTLRCRLSSHWEMDRLPISWFKKSLIYGGDLSVVHMLITSMLRPERPSRILDAAVEENALRLLVVLRRIRLHLKHVKSRTRPCPGERRMRRVSKSWPYTSCLSHKLWKSFLLQ
jgi:hypothetical protein